MKSPDPDWSMGLIDMREEDNEDQTKEMTSKEDEWSKREERTNDTIGTKTHSAEPLTMMDRSKSGNKTADTGLLLLMKQKDEKINRMKMKMAILKEQLDQERLNAISSMSVQGLLQKIAEETGNRFDSIEDCISVLKQISEYSIRNTHIDFLKNDPYSRESPNSERKKYFESKIEDLNDQIYDLEQQLLSRERKYKKKVKNLEIEIDDLQEELSTASSRKPRELKIAKARAKELEQNIEELEKNLECQNDEIASNEKKIKELVNANNSNNIMIEQITNQIKEKEIEENRLKDDIVQLNKTITTLERESQDTTAKNEELLKKKQKAIEVMKEKIEHFSKLADEWKSKAETVENSLDEHKQRFDAEQEKYKQSEAASKKQENKIKRMEEKIKNLEDDLHNSKIMQFPRNENTKDITKKAGTQDVGEKPMKPGIKGVEMLACPNCHTMYDRGEIDDHILECLEKSI